MKTLIEIMIPRKEWEEVSERWQKGDLRVVVYPVAWLALFMAGLWLGS